MITEEKIDIYECFHGDMDGFSQFGTSVQKKNISDEEWGLINNFIQDIGIVSTGLSSAQYEELLNKRLAENCEDDKTRLRLIEIASRSVNS